MESKSSSLSSIRELLLDWSNPTYILSHPYPDGDSMGSTMGLYHFLKAKGVEVYPVFVPPWPQNLSFLLAGVQPIQGPIDVRKRHVIVLDCADTQRLAQLGQYLDGAAMTVNIDHHINNELFADVNYVSTEAAAVGEILHAVFNNTPWYTPQVAQALFTAVYTDSGRFSYSNTTADTLFSAAEMVEKGADPSIAFDNIYQTRRLAYYRLLAEALAGIELHFDRQVAIMALDARILARHQVEEWELGDINNYPRSLKDVKISAVFKEVASNDIKLSLRSKGDCNVAKIAAEFGGGGHINAAGATFKMPMEAAKHQLLSRLKQELVR